MSCIFGQNREIFFPKLSDNLHLTTFAEIAIKYLEKKGLKPIVCKTEEEARNYAQNNLDGRTWPCLFTESDTTGEKDFEEFYTDKETLDLNKFQNIGIIKNKLLFDFEKLEIFKESIFKLKFNEKWNKKQILKLFTTMIPDFSHKETDKYLDSKM